MLGWGSLANGSIDGRSIVVSKRLDLTDHFLGSRQLLSSCSERLSGYSPLARGGHVLPREPLLLSLGGLELPLELLLLSRSSLALPHYLLELSLGGV